MLSFFAKRKNSPDTPPEEFIQGPVEPQRTNNDNVGDDFIFVERKKPDPINPVVPNVYPTMPHPMYGSNLTPYPQPSHPTGGNAAVGEHISTPGSYVQGIPFELSPQLRSKVNSDATQMQVDGFLALITRQISVNEKDDYPFTLERSVQSEA